MARLLRRWLDEADMRVDDVLTALKPEHFISGRVPGRTTVSDRLAGVGLKPDFIEAVADICSHDVAGRERLMKQVQALRERAATAERRGLGTAQPNRGDAQPDSAALAAEMVVVQQRSLAVADKLMRAMERAAELEQERNSANCPVSLDLAEIRPLTCGLTG